jgi:hypothetical protein
MLARGSDYFGVADHPKSAHYAGGLGAEKVAEQQAEAGAPNIAPNKKYGREFHIFIRIESDFLTTARGMKIKPLPAGFVVFPPQGCKAAPARHASSGIPGRDVGRLSRPMARPSRVEIP